MKQKKVNVMLFIGVLIAIVLLMVWLLLGTTLEEDTSSEISPVAVEQIN